QTKFAIAPLSFINGHGWVKWTADSKPSHGRNHVNFALDHLGQSLRLYAPDLSLLDAVDFGVQRQGISEGRLPDGGGAIVSFPTGRRQPHRLPQWRRFWCVGEWRLFRTLH